MHEVATGSGTSLAGPTIRYIRYVVKLYSKHAREDVARAAENTVPASAATYVRQHQHDDNPASTISKRPKATPGLQLATSKSTPHLIIT